MTEQGISDAFQRWIPRLVFGGQLAAILVWLFEVPASGLLYGLAGANLLAALVIGMFHLSSTRGSRSVQQLGFRNYWEVEIYSSWEGLPNKAKFLLGSAFLTTFVTGLSETAPGVLAFSTLWLALVYSVMTRQWPSDRGSR